MLISGILKCYDDMFLQNLSQFFGSTNLKNIDVSIKKIVKYSTFSYCSYERYLYVADVHNNYENLICIFHEIGHSYTISDLVLKSLLSSSQILNYEVIAWQWVFKYTRKSNMYIHAINYCRKYLWTYYRASDFSSNFNKDFNKILSTSQW